MTRKLPYDPVLKTPLSFTHILSFSLFFGSFVAGAEISVAERIALVSGLLLKLRELVRGGWRCSFAPMEC